jgi:hypothetical protein
MKHSINRNDIDTLKTFDPVEGTWESRGHHYKISNDIARDIMEFTGFPVTVQLFRENGEHLQGDERNGTMIVVRD